MSVHNQVVFITDADCASGKAIIRRFVSEGSHFILNSESGGLALWEERRLIENSGKLAIIVNIDLCSFDEVWDMLQSTEQQIGTVSVLVHNNNVVYPSTIESCDEAIFAKSIAINAKSAFICTQAAGKHMMKSQHGSIIYVSSIHAEKPTGSAFTYSIAKGAVSMLAKEAALVLGRSSIRVNSIERGPLEGDDVLFESTLTPLYDHYNYKVPNAELGTYEDLAELVLFLASDSSKYINGADIRFDGGFLLHYMNFRMKQP
ncbi:SDR family NAD(P)-dependent oxidoreductase [Paenibacillus sinopodophylli]|uniref:SDR family NAD(P)-dependent oxidoreductase n=1 Tax=Paenibacillus sinopodophylli TaxID=1837342 RepID=UPI00110CE4FB|nr:SDR family oxidoreductase [Paenibacillus sinopodophylli]